MKLSSDKEEILTFIDEQTNKNTARKTFYDVRRLERYMRSMGENRQMCSIPMDELDQIIAGFLLLLKKQAGDNYEPLSVKSMVSSFDRKLKRQRYPYKIAGNTTNAFPLTNDMLKVNLFKC